MKYLLGIDFGGSASKATLMTIEGEVVTTASSSYPTLHPKESYSEQNPEDWYHAAKKNIREIILQTKINPDDIVALSLDAATHTAVLCDENFRVLRPSIYWTDTRCLEEVEYLRKHYSDIIEEKVLHRPDTIWTLPELMWVKNNQRDIWGRVRKILFEKDYVRHRLTGDYVTDYIEAEGSMMFDYNTLSWSDELLGILGLKKEDMPKIVRPTDIVGTVLPSAAEETGLSVNTKVICGTTDTVMEVFAAGGVEKGKMTLKLATAGRICVVTDACYKDKNMINYSHFTKDLWYPGTATKSCAASFTWFKNVFGGEYDELAALAEDVEIGCDGLLFHPYLNGELTPYANPKLCASFTGVKSGHTKAHFTRAVLEGVAFSMLDCMNTLQSWNIPHEEKATIIGGGGKTPLWCRIVSDALSMTLVTQKYSDSSFGSCMLAGLAVGVFKDAKDAFEKCNQTVSEIHPNPENTEKYRKLFRKYKAVQKALEPIYNGEFE